MSESILYSMFLIFSGAAVVATFALFARQALVVAYILLGLIVGPYGYGALNDTAMVDDISQVGIIFLLFLLGLNLELNDLLRLFREALRVTLISSVIFFAAGYLICLSFGFDAIESIVIGAAMVFSSTIIGLKLLPTSALHHQHMGEIMVAILLLQDMLAIVVLLLLRGAEQSDAPLLGALLRLSALPVLIYMAWWVAKHWLQRLIARFDQIQEYLFLLAIGWCLGLAELAQVIGLSHEIGAFIGGVSLATSPIARFLAEALKPLRDFFLIIFFFTLGAGFDVTLLANVWLPTLLLAAAALLGKPLVFRWLLSQEKEKARLARETGVRLGQISEFSLLVAVVAIQVHLISEDAAALLQGASILSFALSSYYIVLRYPTPIAVDPALRRD